MRVADAVADWLHEKKITHAFLIIGGGNLPLIDAIQKKGETSIVCCHHEQAAAMASCYFNRIRGGLESIVLCTTGAGSTNAITGVMAAYMDSIPLLVLSGNEASKYMDARTRVWGVQGYDSSGMATYCAKWSNRAAIGVPIKAQLEMAYQEAISPRQGSAHLDIPKDVASATI